MELVSREEVIRRMQKEDLDEVLKINNECFKSDAWNREAFEREFELNYSYSFVFQKENSVIGYAVVWLVFNEATLMSFAIKKSLWGRGYGKKFMKFLVEYFRGKAKTFFLDVRKSNIRAIRLYKSVGFKIIGEREGYYSDGEDALMMLLELEDKDGDKGKTAEAFDT